MRRLKIIILVIMLFGSLICAGMETHLSAQARSVSPLTEPEFGEPLSGLDAEELGRFNVGKAQFERDHIPEDGLGPNFNEVSCVACHKVPATGGSLPPAKDGSLNKQDLVVRIGQTDPLTGKYDPLIEFGGQVLSRKSVSTFSLPSIGLPIKGCFQPGNIIPPQAQFISFRFGQPLFGLGLIEAISDDTILANADPDDKDHDGISGRPNMVLSQHFKEARIGRFGWKGHWPTLIDFCSAAYLEEIGITTPDFPNERRPNGKAANCEMSSSEPEDNGFVVNSFVDFINFLAPPPQKPLDSSATSGRQIFNSIGCAKCHIPILKTASNPDAGPSLANRDVPLYSDLLLHDMGEDLADGIEQPEPAFTPKGHQPATGREWRTQPLWGLSVKSFYLHDGRTNDLTTAIILHGGEATASRKGFLKLSKSARKDLLKFLKSL